MVNFLNLSWREKWQLATAMTSIFKGYREPIEIWLPVYTRGFCRTVSTCSWPRPGAQDDRRYTPAPGSCRKNSHELRNNATKFCQV